MKRFLVLLSVLTFGNVQQISEAKERVYEDIEKLQKEVAKKLGYKLVDHKLELYGSKIKK